MEAVFHESGTVWRRIVNVGRGSGGGGDSGQGIEADNDHHHPSGEGGGCSPWPTTPPKCTASSSSPCGTRPCPWPCSKPSSPRCTVSGRRRRWGRTCSWRPPAFPRPGWSRAGSVTGRWSAGASGDSQIICVA